MILFSVTFKTAKMERAKKWSYTVNIKIINVSKYFLSNLFTSLLLLMSKYVLCSKYFIEIKGNDHYKHNISFKILYL